MRRRTFQSVLCPLACAALLLWAGNACGQGQFLFWNPQNRTRVGSLDGPYAGRGYWGQMLVGTSTGSLNPVGIPLEHYGGYVGDGGTLVTVPDSVCFSRVYFQLVAWEGNLWGTSLANVPPAALGKTDIVLSGLGCFPAPLYAPPFTQPAIVPVPEPSVVALAVAGAGLLLWRSRSRKEKPDSD